MQSERSRCLAWSLLRVAGAISAVALFVGESEAKVIRAGPDRFDARPAPPAGVTGPSIPVDDAIHRLVIDR